YPGNSTGWIEASPRLLVEICGCDYEFTLVDVSDCGETERYAEFKYIAGEDGIVKIQGGLTGGPNGAKDVVSDVKVNGVLIGSLSLFSYPVYNWIGELYECDEVVISIEWTASTEEIIDSWSVARWDGSEYIDIYDMTTEEIDCE
ncbi:MAG: hypothetical protein R6W71_12205, partial [Bacteroidales bacterium]